MNVDFHTNDSSPLTYTCSISYSLEDIFDTAVLKSRDEDT